MKRKKVIVSLLIIFATGIFMSSCGTQKDCPGMYGKKEYKKEQKSG